MITSLAFPKMFSANKTGTVMDNSATLQNARLILQSKIKEFFGNPEFGSILVEQLFKNNAPVLKEIIIDNIYSTLINYVPQIKISKDDIVLTQSITSLYATITIYNKQTNSNDLFTVELTKDKEKFGENT